MYIQNIFLGKKQLLLFVQSDTASWFCLRTCLFKTFLSRPISRVTGFKVLRKIRVMRKKPCVSANSSTTVKKLRCQFLLLPNEESFMADSIICGGVEFALS